MCGIAGFIHRNGCGLSCALIEEIAHRNQECRGPETKNSWEESREGITVHLYHQRLRIQDLSPAADQPMHSKYNSDIHLVFNGEIYNLDDVKSEFLHERDLETNSDTEVLVECLSCFQTEEIFNSVRGMFAIGSYNSKKLSLELSRDQFGEKPLHFSYGTDFVIFASQFNTIADCLKTLGQEIVFDQKAIYEYLMLGYFPFGSSLIQDIHKLAPGSIAKFNLRNQKTFIPEINPWVEKWAAKDAADKPISELESILFDAVSEQLVGDVPIGVFLSGGVDSTLVSALAQIQNKDSIHSFSLGFSNADFDESKYALKAASELKTHHHAIQMSAEDALAILPDVLRAFPEPLGDPSVFPTIFISKEAKKYVTVTLTGDGADELFFGYGRYARYLELKNHATLLTFLHPLVGGLSRLFQQYSYKWQGRLQRINQMLSNSEAMNLYLSLVGFSHYKSATNLESFERILVNLKKKMKETTSSRDSYNYMRELDVASYLTDNILVKIDRSAMAFGLETRAPFLDKRIALLASRASKQWLNHGEQKHALKVILSHYVSDEVFRRPKMGFGAPIGDWLRTSLNDWASELIFNFDWEAIGISQVYVIELWKKNEASKDASATYLWILLSLANAVNKYK